MVAFGSCGVAMKYTVVGSGCRVISFAHHPVEKNDAEKS
jgi:hypothetical protein